MPRTPYRIETLLNPATPKTPRPNQRPLSNVTTPEASARTQDVFVENELRSSVLQLQLGPAVLRSGVAFRTHESGVMQPAFNQDPNSYRMALHPRFDDQQAGPSTRNPMLTSGPTASSSQMITTSNDLLTQAFGVSVASNGQSLPTASLAAASDNVLGLYGAPKVLTSEDEQDDTDDLEEISPNKTSSAANDAFRVVTPQHQLSHNVRRSNSTAKRRASEVYQDDDRPRAKRQRVLTQTSSHSALNAALGLDWVPVTLQPPEPAAPPMDHSSSQISEAEHWIAERQYGMRETGFSEGAIRLLGENLSRRARDILFEAIVPLQDAGFSTADITNFAMLKGAASFLPTLAKRAHVFTDRGYSSAQVYQFLTIRAATRRIEEFAQFKYNFFEASPRLKQFILDRFDRVQREPVRRGAAGPQALENR